MFQGMPRHYSGVSPIAFSGTSSQKNVYLFSTLSFKRNKVASVFLGFCYVICQGDSSLVSFKAETNDNDRTCMHTYQWNSGMPL